MTNKGIVSGVSGGMLTVVFDRPEACGDCHNCMHGSEDCAKHTITLPGKARVGDTVVVEMDDTHVMAASALAYIVPLTGFLLGLFLGYLAGDLLPINPELTMALCALCGTALAYLVMRALDPRFSKGRWEPRIVSVHSAQEDGKETL